jgi:acyl-CoA thioesterase
VRPWFQVREEGFTHQHPMPRGVPPPETVPSQEELAGQRTFTPHSPWADRAWS